LRRAFESAPRGTQPGAAAPGLGASDQHRICPAVLDVQAGLVDQRLRHVAADAGVARRRIVGPDTLRNKQTGVSVAPRQQIDHAHRVDGLEHSRFGGPAGGGRHEVDGFYVGTFVALVDLTVADQDRGSGIEGHGDYCAGPTR
jgi:hypothetical protein